MNCRQVRDRLAGAPDAAVAGHLEGCRDCARFARRMQTARDLLRSHHGEIVPTAGFAQRVAARVAIAPGAKLGWAALRLLPATVALLLVLVWWSWQVTPDPSSLLNESPTENLLTWVLERAGEGS